MAQKVTVVLIDDLDGREADETVQFGLDGTHYEIDLTSDNADKLREALGGWIGHARKVTSAPRTRRRGAASEGPAAKDVRDWARANGHTVPDRGRIPADVREAYDAAH